MPTSKRRAKPKPVNEGTFQERWTALLKRIDETVPADLSDEEVERDIEEAIEAVRQERRARRL
jgi:hypothetical protein